MDKTQERLVLDALRCLLKVSKDPNPKTELALRRNEYIKSTADMIDIYLRVKKEVIDVQ